MRKFNSEEYYKIDKDEPIRSIVSQSDDMVVVAWILKPGQEIKPHIHPHGQDTWQVVSGIGEYITNDKGNRMPIAQGDIMVARRGEIHGVFNNGTELLKIISIVSPVNAGYVLSDIK